MSVIVSRIGNPRMRKIGLWVCITGIVLQGFVFVSFIINPHAIRATVYHVVETTDLSMFQWLPDSSPMQFKVDNIDELSDFKQIALKWKGHAVKEFQQYVNIMHELRKFGANIRENSSKRVIQTNSPQDILLFLQRGYIGNCGHYSMLFVTMIRSVGDYARIWSLEQKDGLGGNVHAVVEVYVRELAKWVLFDPLNNAFFIENGNPLGLLELRWKLLSEPPKSMGVRVVQERPFGIPASQLLEYYQSHMPNVLLDMRSDFVHKWQRRYGILNMLRKVIDRFPRPLRRFLDNMVGQRDIKVHLIDEYADDYYPHRYYILFRCLLIGLGLFSVWLMLEISKMRGVFRCTS